MAAAAAAAATGGPAGWYERLAQSAPVHWAEAGLGSLQAAAGLPWWAAIPCAAALLRSAVTLPLAAYQGRVLAKVGRGGPGEGRGRPALAEVRAVPLLPSAGGRGLPLYRAAEGTGGQEAARGLPRACSDGAARWEGGWRGARLSGWGWARGMVVPTLGEGRSGQRRCVSSFEELL